MVREQTRPYPTARTRTEWVEREREASTEVTPGIWQFEYEVYESQAEAIRVGGRPFLIVNHKSQLRENHQRIVTGPNGGLMHVTAGEVMDVQSFTEVDSRYRVYHTARGSAWVDQNNVTWTPFMFPTAPWAGGEDEALDPQWVRETFTVPIADQVAAAKRRRLDRAEAKQESGDKRGTTLNLQVGASEDDGIDNGTSSANITASEISIFNAALWAGYRFLGVSGLSGATINSATFEALRNATASQDNANDNIHAEDTATPGAYTTTPGNIAGRTLTTEFVLWQNNNLPESERVSPSDLAAVIQEIADDHDPSAISIIFDHLATQTLSLIAYDGSSADAATLDIDYTEGGGGEADATLGFYAHLLTS